MHNNIKKKKNFFNTGTAVTTRDRLTKMGNANPPPAKPYLHPLTGVDTSSIFFHIDYPAKEVFPSPADDAAAAFDRLMVEKAREEWNKGTYNVESSCFKFWKDVLALVCPVDGKPPAVAVGGNEVTPVHRYNIWKVILEFPPPLIRTNINYTMPDVSIDKYFRTDTKKIWPDHSKNIFYKAIEGGAGDTEDSNKIYINHVVPHLSLPNDMVARGVAYNFTDRRIIDLACASGSPRETQWKEAVETFKKNLIDLKNTPGGPNWAQFINPNEDAKEYNLHPEPIDENVPQLYGTFNKHNIYGKFIDKYTTKRLEEWEKRLEEWESSNDRPIQPCAQHFAAHGFPLGLSPTVGCEEFEIVKHVNDIMLKYEPGGENFSTERVKRTWDYITRVLEDLCIDGICGIFQTHGIYLHFIGGSNSSFTRTSNMDMYGRIKVRGKSFCESGFKRDEIHFDTVVKAFMDKWTAAVKDSTTVGANREELKKQEVAQIIYYTISNKKETDTKYTLVNNILTFIEKSRTPGDGEKNTIAEEVANRLELKERYRCTRCGGGRHSRRSLK